MFRAVSVWVIQASRKKETIFSSVGICCVTALSSVEAPAGYHNKVEKQKARGGRWEEGKGGSRPLFSLPIVPRALSYSLSLALPTIKRGEASVGERREELQREFFDKLGTENNKSFETLSTRIRISLKRRFFSPFSKRNDTP